MTGRPEQDVTDRPEAVEGRSPGDAARRQALRIAGAYAALGLTWILVSDQAVDRLFGGTDWLTPAQSVKGYAFVAVTAALLYLLVKREIDAVNRAKARLQAANRELTRLAAFPRLSPNLVVRVDPDGTLAFANDAVVRATEAMGVASPADLLPTHLEELVRDCLEGDGGQAEVDHPVAGQVLRWSFFGEPVEGAVYGYGKDCTDELLLAARLVEAEKLEAVGRLTAGVAHDFNNLLQAVALTSQLIEQDEGATEEIQGHARAMVAAADHAAALVRRLVAFGSRQPPEMRVVDLNEELRAFAQLARHLGRNGAKVEFALDGSRLPVLADPSQLNQVLVNLVVNASDAIGGPGTITIQTSRETVEGRPMVSLRVADTGPGIPEDVLPHIFEPFFTTKADRGTGLGLATVASIVGDHDGSIEVASQPGAGTTFMIRIPLVRGAPAPGAEPARS